MWIKGTYGLLINITNIEAVYLRKYDKNSVVIANAMYAEVYGTTPRYYLFEGTEEECKAYIDRLGKKLGAEEV